MAELALCRTCARPAARLKPLFTHPERYKRYVLALKLSTGLQIEMNDGLPQHICTECSQEVSRILKFRTNSQKAQTRLLELGYRKNNINNSVSDSESTIVKKESVVQGKNYDSDESLDKRDHEDDSSSFSNLGHPDCIEKIYVHDYVSEPVSTTMKKEIVVQEKNFNSDESLNSDYNKGEFDSFKKVGNLGSIGNNKLSNGKRMKLDGRQSNKAQMVKVKLHKSQLRLDKYLDTSAPLYTCKECKRIYKNKGSFKAHTVIHTGLKFKCDDCGKVLSTKQNLLLHQQSIHGAARSSRLRCPHCEYHAIDNRHLTVHVRTHTGERPYICDACGVGFIDRAFLVQHMSVHITERNVQCKECPAKFKTRRGLNKHQNRSHKPGRWSYQCTYCPKTYIKSNSCRTHMRKSHGIPNDKQKKPICVPNTLKQDKQAMI